MADAGSQHVRIWEFRVRPGREAEFEAEYGPRGAWVTLFRASREYLGTELLRDPATPRCYLTIDRWSDAGAFERFHAEHRAEYAALDARCAAWTESETPLGAWTSTTS